VQAVAEETTAVAAAAVAGDAVGEDDASAATPLEEFSPAELATRQVATDAHGEDLLLSRIESKLKLATTQDARDRIWAEVAGEAAYATRQLLEEGPDSELVAAEESAARFFSRFDRLLQMATDQEADFVWGIVDDSEDVHRLEVEGARGILDATEDAELQAPWPCRPPQCGSTR